MIVEKKTIHSFSSEDSNFPAVNLLETRVTKKWKVKDVGEKTAFVIFKLDTPMILSGVDIGNEHSAFVEVLVGNSKKSPPEFKEILLTSSFMTPMESRESNNPNRVRCFSASSLVDHVAKEKWDLVKVLCTQPFNPRVKFGLAFVTLHSPTPESKEDNTPEKPKQVIQSKSSEKRQKFGKFMLKSDSEEDSGPSTSAGPSMFQRWKESRLSASNEKKGMKEKIESMKKAESKKRPSINLESSDEDDMKPQKVNRNRSALMYDDEDDLPNEKRDMKLKIDQQRKELEAKRDKSKNSKDKSPDRKKSRSYRSRSRSRSPKPKTPVVHSKPSPAPTARSSSSSSPSKSKKVEKEKEKEKEKEETPEPEPNVTYRPFNKLLDGVIFVISGIQNPERADIRQMGLEMGAKYRQDWGRECTHLVCAFKNTPKYREVQGKGKIVSKNWIPKCHHEKKKLSWRKFALDSSDADGSESEGEIFDESLKPKSPSPVKPACSSDDDDMEIIVKSPPKVSLLSSDDDMTPVKPKKSSPEKMKADDDKSEDPRRTPDLNFDMETEDDQANSNHSLSEDHKNIFDFKKFFLNRDLSATDKIKFENYITNLKGILVEKPETADYIIANSKKTVPMNLNGEIVKPLWVQECYDMECMISTRRYVVTS